MTQPHSLPDEYGVLLAFVSASNSSIVITDATATDAPIVFVNPSFERMTGYALRDVLGRNCRFLQNEDRDQPARDVIVKAVAEQASCECLLRNYRKSGEMFWNKLYLFPLRLAGAEVTHFVGVQHDVTREQSLFAELEHTAGERARLIERLERKRRDMARLSRDLINAQESERKALARELHDELGQRLTALNLLLYRTRPHVHAGEALALWEQAEREMTSLVGLVRDLSVSLRPPGLDFFGLEPTVRQLLVRQLDGGPDWIFEYAGLPPRLAPILEISVYRIVQESLTNIVRHAGARHVVVEINSGADSRELELIVRDDGRGFDAASWREHAARSSRAGLAGMSERIQLLGGSFDVDSAPGRGTRITATLPLQFVENKHERDSGG
ncbi:PAS domain-containing protein [Massilia sp. TN1-12]|uniref:PAS domain-containing protein n=1 Tax=Massilia paldalensis TaxID=3377675 RepID=UPI00384DFA3A